MDKATNQMAVPFSFTRFYKVCLRAWRVFALCIAAMLIFSGAYLYLRKPAVEIEAQLMLPPQMSSSSLFALSELSSAFSLGDIFGSSSTINEIEVLKSHNVFLNTSKQLGLNTICYERLGFMKWMPSDQKAPLQLIYNPAIADTIRVGLRFDVKPQSNGKFKIKAWADGKAMWQKSDMALPATLDTPYGNFTIAKTEYYATTEGDKFRFLFSSYSAAAQAYIEKVDIYEPNKNADFIALSVKVNEAAFGKKLLSCIIDNYNKVGMNQINTHNDRTLDFIDSRLDSLRNNLEIWEQRMSRFKTDNQLTDIDLDAQFIIEQTSQLEKLGIAAQIEDKILEQAYAFLSNPANVNALIPTLTSSSAGEASNASVGNADIALYNQLVLERMRLASTAKESNIRIQQLDKQIQEARDAVLASLANAREGSKVKIGELNSLKSKAYGRIGTIPMLESEYVNIYSQLRLAQELYLFMMKQREETSMSLAAVSPTLDILDEPYIVLPGPGIKAKAVIILAILFAIFVALMWIYFVLLPLKPLMSEKIIQSLTKVPILGSTSRLDILASNTSYAIRDIHPCIITLTSADSDDAPSGIASQLEKNLRKAGTEEAAVISAQSIFDDSQAMDQAAKGDMTMILVNPDKLTPGQLLQINDWAEQRRFPRIAIALTR